MNITDITRKYGFHFSKKFGQNFIGDEELLDAIVQDSGATENDVVLEIGAGAGTLTRAIAKKAKRVVSFEIDKSLKPILSDTLQGYDNVEIVYGDIMDEDEDSLKELLGNDFCIVANLPYYITTPILLKFISGRFSIKSITVMVQKEMAERICARAKTSDYGALTVAVDIKGNAIIKRIVPRTCFTPPPQVDSAIVRIQVCEKYEIKDYEKLEKLVKACFAMKRKTLVNNLAPFFE